MKYPDACITCRSRSKHNCFLQNHCKKVKDAKRRIENQRIEEHISKTVQRHKKKNPREGRPTRNSTIAY